MSDIDYGPLKALKGTWKGDKGRDLAPEPDGTETNAYTETIAYTPAGDVDNAERQELVAMHYHQTTLVDVYGRKSYEHVLQRQAR